MSRSDNGASLAISITIEGEEYMLRARDLSALDAKDFRAKVGIGLQAAIVSFDFDIDRVAGFVWLIRRRVDRSLTFENVAASINYDTEILVDINPKGRPKDEEAGDPEA